MTPSFTSALKSAALALRAHLQQHETLSRFHLEIKVSGRLHEGEIQIEFQLSKDSYTPSVCGGDLYAVANEFLRREGWNERNAPLMLESPDSHEQEPEPPAPPMKVEAGNDIPF